MVAWSLNFVLFGFCVIFIKQTSSQKLSFPSTLTYWKIPHHRGNWSVDGFVELSETDLMIFEPLMEVQTCSRMCTIDLTKCQSEVDKNPLPSSSCYCTKSPNNEVRVYIGSEITSKQSGLMLQTVIPSKAGFHPITASRVIGKIPSMEESAVSFIASPDAIQVGLTPNLTLRCEVKPADGKLNSLTSLAIVRNGKERIAKVGDSDGVMLLEDIRNRRAKSADSNQPVVMDFLNLRMKGYISDKNYELGYLELVWELTSEDEIGTYECLVNAVDNDEKSVTISSKLRVGISAPTTDQLLERIRELERKSKLVEKSTQTQINQIKESTRKEHEIMTKTMTNIQKQNIETKAHNDKILNDLATVQRKLIQNVSDQHFETGQGFCKDSTIWKSTILHGNYKSIDKLVTVKFKKPYTNPPLVMQAFYSLDLEKSQNTRARIEIVKIDRYGFTAKCHTWNNFLVYGMGFNWISFSSNA